MTNPFIQNSNTSAEQKGLSISDSAYKRLSFLLDKEAQGTVFRVKVSGGGCSGFQYGFDFDTKQNDDDFVLEQGSVTLVCDKESLSYIDGGEVDFIDSLTGQYFTISNPQATANCGCGTSFSI